MYRRNLRRAKRKRTEAFAAVALVYVIFALMTWRGEAPAAHSSRPPRVTQHRLQLPLCLLPTNKQPGTTRGRRTLPRSRFTLVYGSLVYQLLGERAIREFTEMWGVGLAVDVRFVLRAFLRAAARGAAWAA